MSERYPLILLLLLNLVPLYGVFAWGWISFDLLFLYWMENLIIGFFTVLRMLVRPYPHWSVLPGALFFATFFTVHYGGFCFGHGMALTSLFGEPVLGEQADDLLRVFMLMLGERSLVFALVALFAVQALDWIHDVSLHGLGAEAVQDLMVKPYRRIVVLHLTILAGGFALAASGEPVLGLVLLILIKTASDTWHWRADERKDETRESSSVIKELDNKILSRISSEAGEPVLRLNGKEMRFDSFTQMKASPEYQGMLRMLKFVGALGIARELRSFDAYVDQKIAEEQSEMENHS